MHNLTKKAIGIAAAATIALGGMTVMGGCSQGQAAATVNGEAIAEKTVTDYIENFRSTYAQTGGQDLSSKEAWAQWLVDNGRTPETLREDAIDYYVRTTVIRQDAKKHNINVSDADIDAQLKEIKDYYGYSDDDLAAQIKAIGYTQDSYREYIKESLLQEKLSDQVVTDAKASDEEVLSMANSYSSVLNGAKRVECIVLEPSNEKADDIRKKASEGDFEAVRTENTVSEDYDGWDILVTQDQAVADVVATMEKDQISDVISGDYYKYIVKVTDICTTPSGGFTEISQIPEDLVKEFSDNVLASAKASEFDNYVQGLINDANIVKNPIPEGLPYNVSLDGVSPSTNSNTGGVQTQGGGSATAELDGNGEVKSAESQSQASSSNSNSNQG